MVKNVSLLILEIFLVSFFISFVLILITTPHYNVDFRAFYPAAKTIISNPEKLYDLEDQRQNQLKIFTDSTSDPKKEFKVLPYVNLPYFLAPYIPLTFLQFDVAYYTAMSLMAVLLLINVYFLFKIFKPKIPLKLTILLTITLTPVLIAVSEVQSALFSLLIFTLSYLMYVKKRFFYAGLIVSFLLYKPQILAPIAIYYLVFAPKKAGLGLVVGLVTLGLINLGLMQFNPLPFLELNTTYVHKYELVLLQSISMITWQGLFSHLNNLLTFIPVQIPALIFSVTTLILTFYFIFRIKNKSQNLGLIYSLIIISTLLSGMHFHYHDATLLLFPFYYFISKYQTRETYILVAVGWVTLFFASIQLYNAKVLLIHPSLLMSFILGIVFFNFGKFVSTKG